MHHVSSSQQKAEEIKRNPPDSIAKKVSLQAVNFKIRKCISTLNVWVCPPEMCMWSHKYLISRRNISFCSPYTHMPLELFRTTTACCISQESLNSD